MKPTRSLEHGEEEGADAPQPRVGATGVEMPPPSPPRQTEADGKEAGERRSTSSYLLQAEGPRSEAGLALRQKPPRHRGRSVLVLLMLFVLLALVAVLRLVVGEAVPIREDGAIDWPMFELYLELRRDRLLIGLTVGAALGISGTLLQSLLRNPLASPYILGLSSGAALGYMIALTGWLPWAMQISTSAAALTGAVGTMLIVYLLAQKRGRLDPVGLLLIGVIVNAINGAAIMFINYLNPDQVRGDMMRWMMGYLDDNASLQMIQIVGAITLGGGLIALLMGRSMDVATFGDSEAHAMGLQTGRLRFVLFLVAGTLTAGAVMLAGPIGFVGLICPHIVRLMTGPGHRTVVLGAAMAGGIVVVGADAGVKYVSTVVNIGLMPIGVLTALIGGPAFLLLLRPQLGRGID